MTDVRATTDSSDPGRTGETGDVVADLTADQLVEEVSIDGMCGVY